MPKFRIAVTQTIKHYEVGYHEIEADTAEDAIDMAQEMDDPAVMVRDGSDDLADVSYEMVAEVA